MSGARDPGAQPERTRLAWRRTTLAFAVVVVLELRRVVVEGGSAGGYAGLSLALCTWLVFLTVGQRRINQLAAAAPAAMAPGLALGAGLCLVASATSAAVLLI
ncbi:DUF202 domain-containing protein [Streptomyces sp. CMB-StM0423]|uniref:DUF202 domain-containing protein n=1 Tax=Streptomyces sp. CMB-StM0423 TaxID=2059884 RepID=UPI000C7084D7|nr:DUF202 domain-containing protein [Streptomyces sp. CMB-StM0423]AUH43843.1 hypothetical protein CXR04_29995 [Streptomyces sp. CMB-StM0423]